MSAIVLPPPPSEAPPSEVPPAPPAPPAEDASETGEPQPKRPKPDYYYTDLNKKHTRTRPSLWAPEEVKAYVPGFPKYIPYTLDNQAFDALLLRLRIDELTHRITTNDLGINPLAEDRSPSPPPTYDKDGKRTNTREQRKKQQLCIKRQELIREAMKQSPFYRPPPDYRHIAVKLSRKLYIPQDKYPDYNFIGLIIGPRGLTQKQLEKETGAKIAIRGKGSIKDGKGRMDGKNNAGDEDALHVLITAESKASLRKAVVKISKLLIPVDEGQNEHKRQQLRKLAEINGTLRDHLWNAPSERTWEPTNVKCAICGDGSHPTNDCPQRGSAPALNKLDEEYESYLKEIGETSKPEKQTSSGGLPQVDQEAVYNEFMASIGDVMSASTPVPPAAAPTAAAAAAAPWNASVGGMVPPPIPGMMPPGMPPIPGMPVAGMPPMPGMSMPPMAGMPPGMPPGVPPQGVYPPPPPPY